MSKSSTASAPKPLPVKSAWAKGPPQASAPSPRSQSPAPSTQSHLTHSRRPSALGQGVPIKDGVSIPRSNVGAAAAKQGSAVTFGSIDDASAPISSSPATAPSIKSEGVKSFGSVPLTSHVNGKASISSRSSIVPTASSSSSASATPPSTASAVPHKPGKTDIAKLFQSPSAPATTSTETQSPTPRTTSLPSQQQQQLPQGQTSSAAQSSQFGSHFTPFVPSGSGMRPQPQNSGPSGPSRSPVYQRQMQNGNGSRSQGPPNGAPPSGLSSPRLAPPHNGQPSAVPPGPQGPPPMMWPGYYYPPEQYMQYPSWGYMPQQLPPHPQHPHPQHHPHPQGPHIPPHPGMPMSPRNPQPNLQGPGTPTLSHATPNPVHPPHPPPPLSHPSNSISGISSPPPTPSTTNTGRLNASSSTFVPQRTKITFKDHEGKEVPLESLTKSSTATSTSSTVAPSQSLPYRQSSPGTPKRASIRMETEEQQRKRLAEEEEKEKEKARAQAEAEAKVKKQKEEEERKIKQEERRKKEVEERLKKEEEEKERLRKEEEERIKKEEEERIRKEEERIKKEEEEKERLRKEEEERQRLEDEREREKERLRLEEELRSRAEEERRKQEEAERAKEQERLRLEEEAEKTQSLSLPPFTEEGEVSEPTQDADEARTKEDAKEKAKETLRINTSTSPVSELGRKRPGPLDLTGTKSVPAGLPSALSTARNIEDINGIRYPEGIQSPKPELNTDAKDGRFRYDRDFLLQFMSICKEKPDMLPPLDAIGLEPIEQSSLSLTRGGSGRHRGASSSVPSRQASVGLGFVPGGFSKTGANNYPSMGNFTTPGKLSSDDRFAMSNTTNRSTSVNAASGLPFGGRPPAMQRTASQGGPGSQIRERTRSKRGEKRNETNKAPNNQQNHGSGFNNFQNQQNANFEPVAPLQASANRWDRKALLVENDSPELVDRKVKGLLNKLTMEKFDSISDQIISWANKSEKEKDGRTLIQVIRLVFEKATDEATWSEMYARLCRKMMEQISPNVQDDGIKNTEGKPITGGQLFRKYLLNRCQEDFERGWVAKEATAAAAASKALEDEAAKAANEKGSEEIVLYSDEYYAAQKAKRQGLGLIKFIGELFKLQMLTERIMHECVKKLLGNVENPEEEEIESLCKLLITVGAILDTPKARAHMDVYFSRMKELTKSLNVSSRMQFMLQDVIELRERKWITRNTVAAPTTLAQVHENAAKEKAEKEKEAYQRQLGMSRTSSNRGRGRNDFDQTNPDGWAVAGGGSGVPRPPPKAGDLSNFGKISKTQPMNFGPSSVFTNKKAAEKRESISRTSSSSNMFSMLSQNAEGNPEASAKPEPQRRRLVLQPRSVPIAGEESSAAAPTPPTAESDGSSGEEEDDLAVPEMTEAEAGKKIKEDLKEFFAARNLDEAEVYFATLPPQYHHKLVDKLITEAIESKEVDAELVTNFFERAASKELCSVTSFEEGFTPIAEIIDDIAIDVPKAFQFFARMMKGAGLDEERRKQLASKSMDSDKLLALLS